MEVGAYIRLQGNEPSDPVPAADLEYIEGRVGQQFDIVHYFYTWGRPFEDAVANVDERRELMLSMRPDDDLIWQIAAGDQDEYIAQFMGAATEYGDPVYIRFGHEMNGEWMPYSMAYSEGRGPRTEEFVEAWRHLYEKTQEAGADNVKLIWSPNEYDFPDQEGNRMENYWPGEEYVDIAGFSAYNWGDRQPARGDQSWRTFEEIVEDPYARVRNLTPEDMPIWLTEFGTIEPDEDAPPNMNKKVWFEEMFTSRRFEDLEAIIYFSEDDQVGVQRDWRLDTSEKSLEGFRNGWARNGRETLTDARGQQG